MLSGNLIGQVQSRLLNLEQNNPMNSLQVPIDLVTSSASGLDPHISPASAYYQVPRVARERSIPEEKIRLLVQKHIEFPLFGYIWCTQGEHIITQFVTRLLQLDK